MNFVNNLLPSEGGQTSSGNLETISENDETEELQEQVGISRKVRRMKERVKERWGRQ